jgi:hypothetical protein
MVAEREGEIVKSERFSSLIAVAKARVWASEGWQVTITNADGKVFGPEEFDELLLAGRPAKPKCPETKLAPEMNDTPAPETDASSHETDTMAGA